MGTLTFMNYLPLSMNCLYCSETASSFGRFPTRWNLMPCLGIPELIMLCFKPKKKPIFFSLSYLSVTGSIFAKKVHYGSYPGSSTSTCMQLLISKRVPLQNTYLLSWMKSRYVFSIWPALGSRRRVVTGSHVDAPCQGRRRDGNTTRVVLCKAALQAVGGP